MKRAVSFIGDFENAVAAEAVRHGADVVLCGHIHHPVMKRIGMVDYINTGDWVESCSAVVEHFDGRLELLSWTKHLAIPLPDRLSADSATATATAS